MAGTNTFKFERKLSELPRDALVQVVLKEELHFTFTLFDFKGKLRTDYFAQNCYKGLPNFELSSGVNSQSDHCFLKVFCSSQIVMHKKRANLPTIVNENGLKDEVINVWRSLPKTHSNLIKIVEAFIESDYLDMPQDLNGFILDVGTALYLLSARISDSKLRKIGVDFLEELDDEEFALYITQIVECIKFELFTMSDLARVVLRRCWKSAEISCNVFWLSLPKVRDPKHSHRFAAILEGLIKGSGLLNEFVVQKEVMLGLKTASENVKRLKSINTLHKCLESFSFTDFTFPLKGRFIYLIFRPFIRSILIDECRYMDSKKVCDS